MIKYIGSKRTLVDGIVSVAAAIPNARSVLDLFSGSARVGHAFKKAGFQVVANDHNAYAHTLATCYVQTDREAVEAQAETLIAELNRLPGNPGYITETFCLKSRFFQPKNGERIDAIRERIEELDLNPELKSVLLVALMEAADRVDSTTGLQMAYLKAWAARSYSPLELRMPDVVPSMGSPCKALHLDALDAAKTVEVDIAYLDPPYNQHSYLGNYHIWESLVLWDKPAVYGIACKRVDCRERASFYNSKVHSAIALAEVIKEVQAKTLIVSFSDEGFITRDELEAMLQERGSVEVITKDYKRYVGAQIGIHNRSGVKVGKVGHLRNNELLFICRIDAISAIG